MPRDSSFLSLSLSRVWQMIVTYLQILDMDTETDAATTLRQKAW